MGDFFDRITRAVAGRYTVERQLGIGGTSIVYLAQDSKLDRQVALKVLRPELALEVGSERFLREVRIAARLQHPHILPLYDSDSSDGFLYYVMPYVEGEALRHKMDREKQLSLDEAVSLTAAVGRALDYAHRQGVIHRDIKPENVLLHDGQAVVADFGIALALDAACGDPPTTWRLVQGTPGYMSPEQLMADPEVDGRTDIYSLGCVLYEMLAGRLPFTGPSTRLVIAGHMNDPAPPVSTIRPEVGAGVCRTVSRALAKSPADRFAAAGEFVDALLSVDRRRATPLGDSIAVLPFTNMTGDPRNEHLGDGLTEEIINALTSVDGLKVASRTSAFTFKMSNGHIQEIGERLRVKMVLEGSVKEADGVLRITAQLINVADGYHLWSERYDRRKENSFGVEDEIAADIVGKVKAELRCRVSGL